MYDTWEIPERRTLHKSTFLAIMYVYLLPRWLSGKESPCNAGDVVRSLNWEDPLEEEMATRSSILTWNIPWSEEPGGLQSMAPQRVRLD